jgi:pyruvate/2-oxoglutarate dehydrogenase complex dihydrolipoamide acyltransferase (E2) component
MPEKVIMPQLGESVVEGTLIKWLVKEGDRVEEFDSLMEVESAKVNTEIPSPATGTLLKILVEEGNTVKAGTILGWIGDPEEKIPTGDGNYVEEVSSETTQPIQTQSEVVASKQDIGRNRDLGFISPVVARLARENNIDLSLIQGTGNNNRITKKDVLQFIEKSGGSEVDSETAAWETPGEGVYSDPQNYSSRIDSSRRSLLSEK